MIEVNLMQKKKKLRMPHVMGVDLGQLNFKLLGLALLIYYLPDFLVTPVWQEEIRAIDQQLLNLTNQVNQLRSEVSKDKNIQDQLSAYNEQISILEQRSQQVDQIISKKTNPKLLLEKIARIIPEDMWLSEIVIDEGQQVVIKGGSFTYKSIGSFIVDVNETLFFNKSLTLGDSKTVSEKILGQDIRIEQFEIKGKVASFSPWAK